ncbi:MAG: hypothetical protein Q8R53_05210 [Nanoarchaeota archaeon]|nr:hypothetical protein [Nanoarchaeota archaeon]
MSERPSYGGAPREGGAYNVERTSPPGYRSSSQPHTAHVPYSDAALFIGSDYDRERGERLQSELFRALALYGFGSGISYPQPEDEREKERRRYSPPRAEEPFRPSGQYTPLVSRKKDGGLEKKVEQMQTEKDQTEKDKSPSGLSLLPYRLN